MIQKEITALQSLISFGNGKSLPDAKGSIDAFGGNGIIGSVPEPNYPAKTIIIGRVGSQCGNIHRSKLPCWVTDNALAGVPKLDSDFDFLYYLLRQLKLNKMKVGSGQPLVTQSILNAISVVIPSDPNYRANSTKILTTLDAKIELNHRINQELEGLAKLLYDYWFVQFDFPISAEQATAMGDPTLQGKPYRQSGGKMTYNPTLKREIPDGWEVKQLSDICRNVRNTIDPTKIDPQTPYVGLEHVPRRAFFLDDWDKASSVGSLKSRFSEGDILFGKLRPYFHKVARVDMEGICTSELLVLRATKAKFEGFMGSLVFSDLFVQSASKQWGGAQMPRAEWNRMKEFKFALPTDSHILDTFNTLILPLWKQGGANQQQNHELATLRDWLLPMLMNGQVTVAH